MHWIPSKLNTLFFDKHKYLHERLQLIKQYQQISSLPKTVADYILIASKSSKLSDLCQE